MSVYQRKHLDGTLHWHYRKWVRLPDGTRERISGTPTLNTKRAAQQAELDHIKRLANPPPVVLERLTVEQYAQRWIAKRRELGVASVDLDESRLDLHVLPRIRSMLMHEVRPRHIRDLILELRQEGKLGPRTIRHVGGLLSTMFKSAVIAELIVASPVVLERGVLPKKADKDPTWRHEAIYTRDEVEQLISDERVLLDRRVLYGLKMLAALRHSEAANLRWSHYDGNAQPLGRLALGKTKSGVPRAIPVHPTLAALLAAWKLSGWAATYGRRPTADDLIVPTRNMTARKPKEAQEALVADLELLQLRVRAGEKRKRRGHDLRRTMITLARVDGARGDILEWVTHGPRGDIISVYTSLPWPALCAEVAKLNITLREGTVVGLGKRVGRWAPRGHGAEQVTKSGANAAAS